MMTIQGIHKCTALWTLVLAAFVAGPIHAQELPLGSAMPQADANLSNVQGGNATLGALSGDQGTVVVFWSNQCPWVERYESRLRTLADEFGGRGFSFVLVNSNDVSAYPQEGAEESAERFRSAGFPGSVTYLSDRDATLARAFGAERTPHIYVFNGDRTLVYVGTVDDSPGDPGNVGEQYLRDALDAVSGGSNVAVPQTKAFGCTIKSAG